METKNVMIVGVGGQGSLLASKLLGALLVAEGYDVKVSEVHGMSQRGGSVVTYVRFGDNVYSPVIAKGEADYIISFEKIVTGTAGRQRQERKHRAHGQTCKVLPHRKREVDRNDKENRKAAVCRRKSQGF